MALRLSFVPRLALGLIGLLSFAIPPRPVAAASPNLPALADFALALTNGEAAELRGIYAAGILADRVVQQPAGNPAFVSPRQYIVTQFSSASAFGSIGLLAHNYLAGASFSALAIDQTVYLIYGDGTFRRYTVRAINRLQAAQPENPQSSFTDLGSNLSLSAAATFDRMYARPGALVLQTCITADGNPSWGRLFVIAEPQAGPAPARRALAER